MRTLNLDLLDRYIDEIDRARSLDDIHYVVLKEIQRLGFGEFSYQLLWPPEGPQRKFYITNYPKGWTKRYLEKDHVRNDLVSRTSAMTKLPFLWHEMPNLRNMTDTQRTVFHEASEFGHLSGGTVPLHGPGRAKALFAVASDKPKEEFEKLFLSRRHELHLIATYSHERLIEVGLHNPPPPSLKLLPREIEIMTLTAQGKTEWDISVILSISESQVKESIRRVCNKLGVFGKTHATAVLIINGLILP